MLPNVVLFQAQDALNQSSLWETNGTASGTFGFAGGGQFLVFAHRHNGARRAGFVRRRRLERRRRVVDVGRHGGRRSGVDVHYWSEFGRSLRPISPSLAAMRCSAASTRAAKWTLDNERDGRRHVRVEQHHRSGVDGGSAERFDRLQPQGAVRRLGHRGTSRPVGDQWRCCGNTGADRRRRSVDDRTRPVRHGRFQQ